MRQERQFGSGKHRTVGASEETPRFKKKRQQSRKKGKMQKCSRRGNRKR